MLELLRRYQKFLFIIITVVIVISFSFFGTYSSFASKEAKDRVAFIAVDGSKVYSSQLQDVIQLISSSQRDYFSGMNAKGNSFNDGVIQKNICETGIYKILVQPYLNDLSSELKTRMQKEQSYTPYIHPGAPFIGSEQIWSYFAPDIKQNLDALKQVTDPATLEAFSTRVNLFLAERRFPAAYLKQLLKFQEREQKWLESDDELPYRDLDLFGYHNLQDWFGKGFIELVAKYIINSAKIAEQKGYEVSKDEVLQSLIDNVTASFKENSRNPYFGHANFQNYFQSELRHVGMDQARLLQAWRNVLLFRKLFNENEDAILVSDLAYKDFYRHLSEYVDVEFFKMPQEFCLNHAGDLQRLEIYLSAIRGQKDIKGKGISNFPPQNPLSPQEVKKVFPELVKRRYRLRISSINKAQFETKIGVKNMWEWQLQDKNWEKLQKKFPELAAKKAQNAEARLSVFDSLDIKSRSLIDSYSRSQIIEEHPEWLQEGFENTASKDEVVELREQGGLAPLANLFEGISNYAALMNMLDKAELNEVSPELASYSQNGINYYRIIVLEKPVNSEILTFKEAESDGTLDAILDKLLEGAYPRLRSQKPEAYVKDNGEWKPLDEVKDVVADAYFEDLYRQLDKEIEKEKKENPRFCDWNDKVTARLAVRLLPYMQKTWKNCKDHPEKIAEWVHEGKRESLQDQFKLERVHERVSRAKALESGVSEEAFSLQTGQWLEPRYFKETGIVFLSIQSKGALSADDFIRAKVLEARKLLGQNLTQDFAKILLADMQAKQALQLEDIGSNAK